MIDRRISRCLRAHITVEAGYKVVDAHGDVWLLVILRAVLRVMVFWSGL
jgi:hypothetical protein